MQQILNAILVGLIVFLIAYIYCTSLRDGDLYGDDCDCMYGSTPGDGDQGSAVTCEDEIYEQDQQDQQDQQMKRSEPPKTRRDQGLRARKVHFDDTGIISTDDSMLAADGGEWNSMSIDDVWDTPMQQDEKEDAKIKKMIQETLRDEVDITEDNINGDVSDKVKSAYSAPRAGEIRSSQAKARDLVPEMTSNKVDGNIDFAMAYMYAGRGPNTKLSTEGNAEWGVTDAYMHQKAVAYENGL